jgi:hypothetical protein
MLYVAYIIYSPYTIHGPQPWSCHKDLNGGPLCPQSPTLTTLPSLNMHVHMKNHFTFITLMATLDRQNNKGI